MTSDTAKTTGEAAESEMSWDEFERFFAEYEKDQLRQFYTRIGPIRQGLLGATKITGYKTPGSNYRWGTRQKRRK